MIRHARLEMCLLLSVLISAAAFGEPSAKTYQLRQKYNPGTYYMVMKMEMQQKRGTAEVEEEKEKSSVMGVNMDQTFVIKMVVSQPDDAGQKTMKISYERIQQVMKMGNVALMQYDSMAKNGNPMMAQSFAPLLKVRITAVLDKDDNIVSVTGFEKVWDDLQKANPAAKAMLGKMKESFNNDSIKQMIQSGQESLPSKPVAVGESWTNSQTIPIPMVGEMKLDLNLKLASVEEKQGRQIADIIMSGTAKNTGEAKAVEGTPLPMKIKGMEILQKGIMQFDITAGQVSQSDMQQTVSMTMSMVNPNDPNAQPMNMNMAMESDVKIKTYFNTVPKELTPPTTAPASAPAKE